MSIPAQHIMRQPSCPEYRGKSLEPEVFLFDLLKVQRYKRPLKPRRNKLSVQETSNTVSHKLNSILLLRYFLRIQLQIDTC